ncbi:MAG: Cupredoxin-like protein [Bacteroidetes bacterium]|nr:Cupredoxin-like protein [Bacteroidota bacterium]
MKKLIPFFAVFILFSNCSKKPTGEPGPNEIWLEYQAFHPSQRSIAVGTTITFTNKDNADHTATSTGHFDSGRIRSGNTYTYTFNTAGVYYFFCNYHANNSSEQGAIRVQ